MPVRSLALTASASYSSSVKLICSVVFQLSPSISTTFSSNKGKLFVNRYFYSQLALIAVYRGKDDTVSSPGRCRWYSRQICLNIIKQSLCNIAPLPIRFRDIIHWAGCIRYNHGRMTAVFENNSLFCGCFLFCYSVISLVPADNRRKTRIIRINFLSSYVV